MDRSASTAPLPGYRLGEEIARDDLHVVVRAVRDGDGARVMLKRPRSTPAALLQAAALRREHEVLGEIQGQAVPRVLAFEPVHHVLVLEDIGGVPLPRLLAAGALAEGRIDRIDAFLTVALQLVAAVGQVHDRGFIHRGLRVPQVLVVPDSFRVQVMDFSTASRLAEEVDHRADFHALGAIFHELLTGRRPLPDSDPPAVVDPRIPVPLSDITMKLLSRMAEHRYQSARGIEADLRRFDREWRETGPGNADVEVEAFPLGSEDIAGRFSVPRRLHGRERQVQELMAAFERAASGGPAFVFVRGPAGVGKSSVVNEVQQPIVARSGRFAAGKFDQNERGIPHAALIQALRALCAEASAEPAAARTATAERLQEALGAHTAVIAEVVPELEALVGPCGQPPLVGPAEARNRFTFAVQSLLAVLARDQRPLVIFLDDLQWADLATLRLLSSTLATPSPELPLLWIGAYRDDEVPPDHPLCRFRAELRERGVPATEIDLSPLALSHLTVLLQEALHQEPAAVGELARLLEEKTGGNPFFVIQVLKSLEQQKLLWYDRPQRRWCFDLARGEAAGMTGGVLPLLTRKLHHLTPAAREAVVAASCIGNAFSLETLAVILQQSQREAASELWEAIQEGLVRPVSPHYEVLIASGAPEEQPIAYRFLHDRVQQAAYALIPEDRRKPVHLEVGRLLLARHGEAPDRPLEHLFEIVGHLNLARDVIDDPAERRRLAALDLRAGRQARSSGAIQTSLDLFSAGRELLAGQAPAGDDLAWRLAVETAECEFLCGHAERAERGLDAVIAGTPFAALQAEAFRIRIVHYEDAGRFADAVRVGLEALAPFGVRIAGGQAERMAALEQDLARIDALIGDRPIAGLIDAPTMPEEGAPRLAAILIVAMWPSAFLTNLPGLTAALSARLVRLSLEHGHTAESALGYITHAIAMNARSRDQARGYALGQLGLAINERFGDAKLRARVADLFGTFLAPWREPLEGCARHSLDAHRAGIETGDLACAGRAAFRQTWYPFLGGRELERFEEQARAAMAFLERTHQDTMARAQHVLLQASRALRGLTRARGSLAEDGVFDEEAVEAGFAPEPVLRGILGVARVVVACHFGDHRRAYLCAEEAAGCFAGSAETIWHSALDFYRGLAIAAVHDGAPPAEQPALRDTLDHLCEEVRLRAASCPDNFAHQHHLLAAERARLRGDHLQAGERFSLAAVAADRSGFLDARALTRERAGRFWLAQGDAAAAGAHLTDACELYRQWGAQALVQHLRASVPPVVADDGPRGSDPWRFDAASALEAAQAIAAEIELDRLLPRLIKIAVENAGAERGVLLELAGEDLLAVAEAAVADEGRLIAPPLPLAQAAGVLADQARALVSEVQRSGETRLVSDGGGPLRSALAVPIARQGVGWGVLYLENSLSSPVFTEARVEMVRVLASQAAISLENARLYEAMKGEVRRRADAEAAATLALADLEALNHRLQAENVHLREEVRTPPDAPPDGGARTIEAVERAHIVSVLRRTSWVVEGQGGAALILGLHPNTLRSRMKRLGIVRARHGSS